MGRETHSRCSPRGGGCRSAIGVWDQRQSARVHNRRELPLGRDDGGRRARVCKLGVRESVRTIVGDRAFRKGEPMHCANHVVSRRRGTHVGDLIWVAR